MYGEILQYSARSRVYVTAEAVKAQVTQKEKKFTVLPFNRASDYKQAHGENKAPEGLLMVKRIGG